METMRAPMLSEAGNACLPLGDQLSEVFGHFHHVWMRHGVAVKEQFQLVGQIVRFIAHGLEDHEDVAASDSDARACSMVTTSAPSGSG